MFERNVKAEARDAALILRHIYNMKSPLTAFLKYGPSWQEQYQPPRIAESKTFPSRRELRLKLAQLTPELLENAQQCQTLADSAERALQILSARERFIVKMHFGRRTDLEGRERPRGSTLREIADTLGLSRNRTRQIESEAIMKLRSVAVVQELNNSLAQLTPQDHTPGV